MRAILILALLAIVITPTLAQPTPAELWRFQGIEDVNAFAALPDANGDGVADILVETYDAGASGDHLYLLSGGDVGIPAVIWSIRPSSGASDGGGYGGECLVSCDDLGGDGFPDALLGTAWGNRSVHAVDGLDGTVLWTFDTYDEPASGWVYAVRAHPDRTGDGRPEVVFGAGSENHRGYLLDGSDGSIIWRFLGAGDAIGHTVSLPDMNRDGIADVLFSGWDNEHRVFCVSGAGEIVGTQIWSRDTGSSNHSATVIDDVTGDGTAEVVVGTWQASNQVLCLDGADGSTVWTFHNGSYNYIMRLVTVDDVDGDGYRDIAVGSWSNGLPVVSGSDGSLIWMSYAGTTNGGDFWAVDTVDDIDGDGIGEVIGGSFDYSIYLFAGANGDTLWTYDTGNRLYSVFGGPDLSSNLVPDVLGGTQYLSGGGRAFALEGGQDATPVPDLPTAAGRATRFAGAVELRWDVSRPLPCVVDRMVGNSRKAAADRLALAQSFEHGELDTREVLAAVQAEKSQAVARLTPVPVLPREAGDWAYGLVDPTPPGGEVRYRVSAILDNGREVALLELTPGSAAAPQPLLQAVTVTPNPFNPLTFVKFSLDRAQHVRLDVYDVEGRRVSQIADGAFIAGEHSVRWTGQDATGRDLPSGTYMVQMVTENAVRTSKMTLVR